MASLPKTYKAVVMKGKGAPLEIQELELKQPARGEVLVKVLACGVCHSDLSILHGHLPNAWPLVPGHEIVGDVAAIGEGVERFQVGDRVAGGWHGGHDGLCRSCRRGVFQLCENVAINGVTRSGGYAEYVLLRSESVARVAADLDPAETAPLLCAGMTVFNGLRKLHVEQGGLVAVAGLGGLGHLAVQYARAMGYRTVAVSSGPDKRDFAARLGAHEYIDSSAEDPALRLAQLGGADVIIATAPNPKAIGPLLPGIAVRGKLLVLAPIGPVEFNTAVLVNKAASVHGWASGHALDSEEAIEFARRHGVRCLVEKYPLSEVRTAFETLEAGKPRFRNVLVME